MPIFYDGSSLPSSRYSNPSHGTMGVLRKGPDPRSRVRRKTREERLAEREYRRATRESAAKVGAERAAARQKASSQRRLNLAKFELESNPEAMRMERLRQQTKAQDEARRAARAGGVKRLTPSEQFAKQQENATINRIRSAPLPFSSQFGPEVPEEPIFMTPVEDVFGSPRKSKWPNDGEMMWPWE